jgi:hypothetical protein
MDLHQQLDGTSSTPYISYQPSCTPYLERSRGRNPTSGSHNLGVKNGSWENSAIKGLQNLRRNSIQRKWYFKADFRISRFLRVCILKILKILLFSGKIFEQELAQAKTTESVKMELNQVRSITRRLLEAPTLPARKLSSSTPNLTLIGMDSDQLLGPPQVSFACRQKFMRTSSRVVLLGVSREMAWRLTEKFLDPKRRRRKFVAHSGHSCFIS